MTDEKLAEIRNGFVTAYSVDVGLVEIWENDWEASGILFKKFNKGSSFVVYNEIRKLV